MTLQSLLIFIGNSAMRESSEKQSKGSEITSKQIDRIEIGIE